MRECSARFVAERAAARRCRGARCRARAHPAPTVSSVPTPPPPPPPSRRAALASALASAAALSLPRPASAEAAISDGTAELPTTTRAQSAARALSDSLSRFLKSRHAADGGARLLGPVRASGDRLRQAADVLLDAEAAASDAAAADARRGLRGAPPPPRAPPKRGFGGRGAAAATSAPPTPPPPLPRRAYSDVLRLVRAASFECFTFDALDGAVALPASLAGAGTARCTLQIVAREAVRALGRSPDQAALARATADEADALTRALQLLDERLDRAAEGDGAAAAGVDEAMERALRVQAAFQGLIERCLFE